MPNKNAHLFNPKEIATQDMYKLMIGSVVPRPIAWVSSKAQNGTLNLAPFSFFTVASRKPPTLLLSIGPGVKERKGTVKDTLTNICETKEFVINVVTDDLANSMHESSKNVGPEVNEFEKAGLTPEPSVTIEVPAVKESPIAFECKLDRIIEVGTDHLVLGTVERARVDEAAYLGNYKTDIAHWDPLARLAGDYATLTPSFSLPRT